MKRGIAVGITIAIFFIALVVLPYFFIKTPLLSSPLSSDEQSSTSHSADSQPSQKCSENEVACPQFPVCCMQNEICTYLALKKGSVSGCIPTPSNHCEDGKTPCGIEGTTDIICCGKDFDCQIDFSNPTHPIPTCVNQEGNDKCDHNRVACPYPPVCCEVGEECAGIFKRTDQGRYSFLFKCQKPKSTSQPSSQPSSKD